MDVGFSSTKLTGSRSFEIIELEFTVTTNPILESDFCKQFLQDNMKLKKVRGLAKGMENNSAVADKMAVPRILFCTRN